MVTPAFLMWPGTSCMVVTLLGLNLGLTEMQSQNPHLELSSLSCVNINLATLKILPAATFTYHTPLWHGTWRRNRAEKSVLLRLLLRLSCTTVLLSHWSLHRSRKHYGEYYSILYSNLLLSMEIQKTQQKALYALYSKWYSSTDAPPMQPQEINKKYKGLFWTTSVRSWLARVKKTQWNG